MADIRLTFSNDPKVNPMLGAYSKSNDNESSSVKNTSSRLEDRASDLSYIDQAASLSYEAAKNNNRLIYRAKDWIATQTLIKAINSAKYVKNIGKVLPFINAGVAVLETGIGYNKDLNRGDGLYTETLQAGVGAAGNILLTSLAITGAVSLGASTAPLLLAGAAAGYLGQWAGEQLGLGLANMLPDLW